MSNFLLDDYETVIKFMDADKQKKKFQKNFLGYFINYIFVRSQFANVIADFYRYFVVIKHIVIYKIVIRLATIACALLLKSKLWVVGLLSVS